jgi:hypothetical protein
VTPPRLTLADMSVALEEGKITEAEIRSDRFHWAGAFMPDTGRIVINPHSAIVEHLVHELVHRLHPRWGEKRVQAEGDRLFKTMTSTDVAAFYRKYQALARKRKTPIVMKD